MDECGFCFEGKDSESFASPFLFFSSRNSCLIAHTGHMNVTMVSEHEHILRNTK